MTSTLYEWKKRHCTQFSKRYRQFAQSFQLELSGREAILEELSERWGQIMAAQIWAVEAKEFDLAMQFVTSPMAHSVDMIEYFNAGTYLEWLLNTWNTFKGNGDKRLGFLQLKIGTELIRAEKQSEAEDFITSAVHELEQHSDSKEELGAALRAKGLLHASRGNFDEAISSYEAALQCVSSKHSKAQALSLIAGSHRKRSEFKTAIEKFLECRNLYQDIQIYSKMAEASVNISRCYLFWAHQEEAVGNGDAEEYYKRADNQCEVALTLLEYTTVNTHSSHLFSSMGMLLLDLDHESLDAYVKWASQKARVSRNWPLLGQLHKIQSYNFYRHSLPREAVSSSQASIEAFNRVNDSEEASELLAFIEKIRNEYPES